MRYFKIHDYRYISYYFIFSFQFSFIGIFLPLYLKFKNFTSLEIGLLLTIITFVQIFAPLLANRLFLSHLKKFTIYIFNILPVIGMLLLPITNSILIFAIILAISSLSSGFIVITDSKLLLDTQSGLANFSYARIAASIGFIVGGFFFAAIYDNYGANFIPAAALISYLLIFALSFNLNNILNFNVSISNLFPRLNKKTAKVIIAFALIWASHSALFMFFPIYLQALKQGGQSLAFLWNFSVVFEIIMFFYFNKLNLKLDALTILKFSAIAGILRWLLLGISSDLFIIFLSQALHAFTFAAALMAIYQIVFKSFQSQEQNKGQAILQAYGFGMGALFGRLLMSYLVIFCVTELDLAYLFFVSSGLCFLALILLNTIPKHEK